MSDTPIIKKSELLPILNQECSKIPWSELQRFFASGNAIFVHESLDLIDTAAEIALDNKEQLQSWMTDELVMNVSNTMAQQWWDEQASVWAVVVAPWVFVQNIQEKQSS